MLTRPGARFVTCLLCQQRAFATSRGLLASQSTPPPQEPQPAQPVADAAPEPQGPLANVPRSHGKRVEDFTPTVLSRPIGFNHPPLPGENTGIDTRSIRQRRDDFVNYEKHLVRRKELKYEISKPYFRDWSNIKWRKGKSFLAPPRLFKAALSLYFPNLYGRTIAKGDSKPRDTTPVLEGKASVVALYSSLWAENQTKSFISAEANPEVQAVLNQSNGLAQVVRVNIEENTMKAWIIRLFVGSLRKQVGKANWGKYFIVQRGISDEIRETIGLLNSKVGYVYLVDKDCRIRWAASGQSEPEEREGLVKGLRRLVDEMVKEGITPTTGTAVRRPVAGRRP